MLRLWAAAVKGADGSDQDAEGAGDVSSFRLQAPAQGQVIRQHGKPKRRAPRQDHNFGVWLVDAKTAQFAEHLPSFLVAYRHNVDECTLCLCTEFGSVAGQFV